MFSERPDGTRESHQPIKFRSLRSSHAVLSAQDLSGLKFDELRTKLLAVVDSNSGLGGLHAYDTAVLLRHIYGVAPEKVYLHSGTRRGAKALGYLGRRVSLELTDLPKP